MSNTIRMTVKVNYAKLPKGHTPHKSGAGKHKNWRREKRQDTKVRLRRDEE